MAQQFLNLDRWQNKHFLKINRRTLFLLSLVTLVGFSGAGILIILGFQEHSVQEIFTYGSPIYYQLSLGLAYGIAAAVLGVILINRPWFQDSSMVFEDVMRKINPQFHHILFYSFCAGVGEEILFRAGIQPLIGVWWTAFIFIALHGYLNPYNISVSIYGALMVVVSAGFGYLFIDYGIYTAMAAHFSFDVAMFTYLRRALEESDKAKAKEEEDEDLPDDSDITLQ